MRPRGFKKFAARTFHTHVSETGSEQTTEGGRNSAVFGSGRAVYCKKLRCALLYIIERTLRRHRAFDCKRAGPGLVAQAVSHRSEWAPKSTQHPLLPPAPTSANARRTYNHSCDLMSVAWFLCPGGSPLEFLKSCANFVRWIRAGWRKFSAGSWDYNFGNCPTANSLLTIK